MLAKDLAERLLKTPDMTVALEVYDEFRPIEDIEQLELFYDMGYPDYLDDRREYPAQPSKDVLVLRTWKV